MIVKYEWGATLYPNAGSMLAAMVGHYAPDPLAFERATTDTIEAWAAKQAREMIAGMGLEEPTLLPDPFGERVSHMAFHGYTEADVEAALVHYMWESWVNQALKGYVRCALESSVDDDGTPLAATYGPDDIVSETLEEMRADCERFLRENRNPLRHAWVPLEDHGYDLWLARNGHESGFQACWYPEGLGEHLTEAATVMGGYTLYEGDDGRLHGTR